MLPIFQIILVCGYTGTPVTADYDMLVQEIELQKDLSVSATTFKYLQLITWKPSARNDNQYMYRPIQESKTPQSYWLEDCRIWYMRQANCVNRLLQTKFMY